jgi:hypothetical protein
MLLTKYLKAIQLAGRKAEECLRKAKVAMKKQWDQSKKNSVEYASGDLVLMSSERLPSL